MTNTQQIRTILEAAGSRYVTVRFIKKDGTPRTLTFNPRHHLETKGTGSTKPADLFTVVDTTKTQWRSFRAHQVREIKANGNVYEFA